MTVDKYIYYCKKIVVSVVLVVKRKSSSHYTVYRNAEGSIRSKNPPKGQSRVVNERRRCVISSMWWHCTGFTVFWCDENALP